MQAYDLDDLEPNVAEAFNDGYLSPLYARLRHGTFHRLSLDRYQSVMNDGFIHPNRGQYESTTSQSARSFGGQQGYISVFDFSAVPDKDFAFQSIRGSGWSTFFTSFEPLTVVLDLNREMLSSKLIPNSEAGKVFHMPHVEAWYPEPIPVEAINARLLILRHNKEFAKAIYREVQTDGVDFDQAVKELTSIAAFLPPRRTPSQERLLNHSLEELRVLYEQAQRRIAELEDEL